MFDEQKRARLAAEKAAVMQHQKLDALLAEMESRRKDAQIERRMMMAMLEKLCSKKD